MMKWLKENPTELRTSNPGEHPRNHLEIIESTLATTWWLVLHMHFLQKFKKSPNDLQDFVYYVPDVMCLTSVFPSWLFELYI